jgi:hypothetical protein
MIAGRGPQSVLVVDRTCVPVWEVCDQAVEHGDFPKLLTRFNITEAEVFECFDTFSDLNGPTGNDFIEFAPEDIAEQWDLDVITAAVSDWTFLTIITYGRTINESELDLGELFTIGLAEIFRDCLTDVAEGHFNTGDISAIHELVFMSYQAQIKEISSTLAQDILAHWKGHDNNKV